MNLEIVFKNGENEIIAIMMRVVKTGHDSFAEYDPKHSKEHTVLVEDFLFANNLVSLNKFHRTF